MYRECRKPVMSYGVLLFSKVSEAVAVAGAAVAGAGTSKDAEPKILMIQRKDSLCYIEFLRGKYDLSNPSYVQLLIDKCSVGEKQRLANEPYDSLWKSLWGLTEIKPTMKFWGDYEKGKRKFEALAQGLAKGFAKGLAKGLANDRFQVSLSTLLASSQTRYPTSEWEFPKGRRNQGETNKECAVREFQEETGYVPDDYSLLLNVKPFEEEYTGENHVRYKHVYYVGYLKNHQKDYSVDLQDKQQVSEIKDIQWFTKSEALSVLRDYHHTRFRVVHQTFDVLDVLGQEYFIVDTI